MINTAFMGSPQFAIPTLEMLNKSDEINVSLVISQKDKKRNRNKISPTEVKKYALKKGLKVFTPDSVNSEEFLISLDEFKIDFIIVVAFGQFIGEKLLNKYRNRIINLHPSKLPKYRGSSPIQYTLLNGDKRASVTSMLIDKGMDSGDLLLQKETEVLESDDFYSLSKKLSLLGAEVILDTILDFDNLFNNRISQNENDVIITEKINKNHGKINWNMTGKQIFDLCRALIDYPKAFFEYKDIYLKTETINYERYYSSIPGFVKEVNTKEGYIKIECSDGAIVLNKIQAPGKKMMPVKDFLMGNKFEEGIILNNG
ncbi:MAG: methionyl-tRNA formyltransferase [Peptoniphilaceae bacterium]|nr:methionyl-tRNA formyltransferase [Peptoniphilaceae bacterium]MDD7382844.1 methionyl-tRNA formyltransferase [Peptoniphilaceae bacterium]